MSALSRKEIERLIQWTISIIALCYISYRLLRFDGWSSFFEDTYNKLWLFAGLLLLQIGLSAINLTLETAKWRQLTLGLIRQSWYELLFQVLKGIQTGLITPARVGEPLVKGALLPLGLRTKGFLMSAAGSIIQNIVILSGGIIAIVMLKVSFSAQQSSFVNLQRSLILYSLIATAAFAITIGLFFLIIKSCKKHPKSTKLISHLEALRELDKKRLARVFLLTLSRYALYNFQLWLMLSFFGITKSPADIALVMLYYAAITILPTMAIADLGIRSSIALFLFGMLSPNSPAIVASVFMIWLINLALPSLVPLVIQANACRGKSQRLCHSGLREEANRFYPTTENQNQRDNYSTS